MCTGFLSAAAAVAASYRAAAEESGRTVDPTMLGLRRRVFVADTDAQAQDKYRAAVDVLGGAGLEDADEHVRAMVSEPDDVVVGSSDTVTEKLVEQCRAGGYGALMAWTDFALFDHTDFVGSHELIGSRVAPALRSAALATEPGTAA